MNDSILNSVKKKLGILEDYTHFDEEIILDINTSFMTLNQLGIGPEEPFMITGVTEIWDDFIADGANEAVKSYIPLKVRLLFDPPQQSFMLNNIQEQLKELEFRMMVQAEKDHLPEYDMGGIYVK
jgi:hypothetical protein